MSFRRRMREVTVAIKPNSILVKFRKKAEKFPVPSNEFMSGLLFTGGSVLYKNFVIKSTFGWNIWNSNLEGIGCVCLITHFLLTAYNYNDWMAMITNDLFWTACVMILQHLVFIIQHYFIYHRWSELDLNEFHEISLQEKISLYEQRLEHC